MKVQFHTSVRNLDYEPGKEGSTPWMNVNGVGKVSSWSPDFKYALVEFNDKFYSVQLGNIKKLARKRKKRK